MNTSAKGSRNELEIMRPFKAAGYLCTKSRMSKGLWDRKAEWTENSIATLLESYLVPYDLAPGSKPLWATQIIRKSFVLAVRSGRKPYFSPAELKAMREDKCYAGWVKLAVRRWDGGKGKPVRWEIKVL